MARVIILVMGVVLVAATGYMVGAWRTSSTELASIEARLGSIEKGHRELQDTFLNGSHESRSKLASSLGYRLLPSLRGPGPGGETMRPVSEEESRKKTRAAYEKLQRDFQAEPSDAKWAGDTGQKVENALYRIAKEGVAPHATQIDCRSTTCKISLNFASTEQEEELTTRLLTDLGHALPNTNIVEIPSDDGRSLDVHIFARRTR